MKKRLLSFVLVLTMILSVTPVWVFAADDDVVNISTLAELKEFRDKVNAGDTYSGKTVTLTADIDLNNEEWIPIGNSSNKFQGTFNGDNHVISNLVITGNNSNVGLFGFTTNGEVKNLTVNNADVSGYCNVGTVVGTPYTSEYTNIKVTGHVEVNGLAYVGGVGGKNAYANWTDITVDVDETSYVKAYSIEDGKAYRTYVGGVIGFAGEGGHTFKNITSDIDVIGSTCDVGGIIGIAHYGNNLVNVKCSGDVTITDAGEAADVEEMGGIAGVWHNEDGTTTSFTECEFTGKLSANITDDVDLSDNLISGKAYNTTGTGTFTYDGIAYDKDTAGNASQDMLKKYDLIAVQVADGYKVVKTTENIVPAEPNVSGGTIAPVVPDDVTQDVVEAVSNIEITADEDNQEALTDAITAAQNEVMSDTDEILAAVTDFVPEEIITESAMNVEVKSVEVDSAENKTLVLDITPVVQVVAKGDGKQQIVDSKAIDLTGVAVTVIIPLPVGFAVEGEKITVVHVKDDGTEYTHKNLLVQYKNGQYFVEFVNKNGFSEFQVYSNKNYVSLGDSMSNGYGLEGYDGNTGVEDYGDESYANQFADYFGFNHAQLAMSAMRAEDLHWLLEVDYDDPAVVEVINELQDGWDEDLWYSVFTNGDYWTWDQLVNNYRFDVAAYCIEGKDGGAAFSTDDAKDAYESDIDALKIVAKYYQESVANADVISLGMGNGNFGVFMFGRIMEAIGFDGGEPEDAMKYDIENALNECDPTMKSELLVLLGEVDKILAEYGLVADDGVEGTSTVEALYNTLMYSIISYALNYAGTVEAILQLNPDAEIILVALMNTIKSNASRAITADVTLGEIMDYLFVPLNAYIAALPTYMQAVENSVYDEATFYWAEADYVQAIVDTYEYPITDDTVRDRFVESIVGENGDGMVWDLLGEAVVPITLEEIEDYEDLNDAGKLSYAVEPTNTEKATSISMYLAFDRAIVKSKNTPVGINSIMGLGSLLDGDPFSSIMEDFADAAAAAGATKLDVVAVFVAGGSNDMVNAEQVVDMVKGGDDAVLAVAYALVAANSGDYALSAEDVADLYTGADLTKAYEIVADQSAEQLEADDVKALYLGGEDAIYDFMAENSEYTAEQLKGFYDTGEDNTVGTVNSLKQAIAGVDTVVNTVKGFVDDAVTTLNDGVVGIANKLCTLLVMPDVLGDTVANSELAGLLALFARCIIGNGIGSHPSEAGHDALYAAVLNAYETEYTPKDETVANLKEAYKYAYAQAVANGYIAQAQDYIDVAIDGVEAAIEFVDETAVDAQLNEVKAKLLNELNATVATLEEIKAVLGNDNIDDTWAAILDLEEDLYTHRNNILALANELGVVVDPYIDQFTDTVNYYADLVETIANEAYAWIANGVEEFNEEYAAWVESVGQLADKVDPALGAAVREYLTETPAEALAIIYAAGDDAVTEFIAAAAAASDDIKVIITAISAVLASDIEAIADAVYNSEQVQEIIDRIDEIKAEIETVKDEMMKNPVSSALAYEQILNALEDQLISFQGELVDAIIEVIDEEVDPAVADMLRKSFDALQDMVDVAENAGSQYADWFDGRFDQMVGDLLTLIIDNTLELGGVTEAVIEDIINDLINDVKDFIDDVEFEDIDLSEIYALIDELKAVADDINAVLNVLKEYADEEVAAIVAELENTLAKVNDFIAQLEAFAQNVENVINKIENEAELTVEKVKAIIAQVEELAAEAEALVNEANASLKLLAATYEKLIPYISELLNYIEEGSPVDVFLDTTGMEVEEFIAVVTSGYEDTIAAMETAAANIDAIVLDTMDVVCQTVADAVEEIVAATETAVNDITEVVTPALDTIKAEAIKLSASTNAKIADAGKQLYALVEAVELTYSESALLAKQDEIEAIVDNVIATLESVETIDDAKNALAQTGDVLTALGNVAADIYEIAEGDVMKLITTADTLAKQVDAIVTITAGTIYSDALAAYGASAAAIFAAVDPAVQVIDTAIDAYEETVLEAAGVIIEAVTEAADNIGNEVVAVADIMVEAAADIAETTESGIESIKAALEYVIYDTTHGEYTIDYDSYYVALGTSDYAAALAEKLGLDDKYAQFALNEDYLDEVAKADLVTVTFDMNEFVSFAYAQAMGMVVEVVKANEDLAGLLNGIFGDTIVEYMTEMGIDMNAKVKELDWSKFDAAAIKAKDEILSIAETVLSEQIEEPVVIFDLGAELASPDLLGFDPDIKVEIPVLELAVAALENVLYSYFEFAVEFPAVLNDIREAAPDAQVVVTGLIDPTEALQAVLPAELNIDLSAVAEYVDAAVAVLNQHFFVYAAINTNTTYVENIDADSIYNALDITREGLLGDANLDGVVDMFDAQLILEYYVDLIDANEIALSLADVNADNIIDMFDAQLILEYYVGLITVFPAE
ncbi:MAG: hypothetical protein IJ325_04820 [Clostridia bacterium]|nr:hypothetical protein [Clostridia bacterium]